MHLLVALPLVPHIIDMKTITGDILDATIRVPNMIVTVLFNYSPKTLKKFLDVDRNFRFQNHYCSKESGYSISSLSVLGKPSR